MPAHTQPNSADALPFTDPEVFAAWLTQRPGHRIWGQAPRTANYTTTQASGGNRRARRHFTAPARVKTYTGHGKRRRVQRG